MFRSQMAEAIYNQMTNSHDAISAGTYVGAPDEPEGRILGTLNMTNIFKVLDEHNINIRDKQTKRLTPEMLKNADIVVSMAEEPYIPDFLKKDKKVIWWDISNPDEVSFDFAKETYEKLTQLIRELTKRIHSSSF